MGLWAIKMVIHYCTVKIVNTLNIINKFSIGMGSQKGPQGPFCFVKKLYVLSNV